MDPPEEIEMSAEEDTFSLPAAAVSFQLQLDKPIPFQVIIAEWNPEKDLLAMVTEDSRIFLHRFNWQRLWTVSPGKGITSLCWRPDGKMIAVGLDDGSIALHDVENGKLLRNIRSHGAAVVCLTWQEEDQSSEEESSTSLHEDRTPRFFPPPRMPQMSGLSSGDSGLSDDLEDTFGELSCNSQKHFNILCSGDKDGNICFSIFGIFPIGKVNIGNLAIHLPSVNDICASKLTNASLHKLSFSRNLCHLTILTFGSLAEDGNGASVLQKKDYQYGMHCFHLNTSIFRSRRNELYQVALQASCIGDLMEVIHTSLSLMQKQWSEAMNIFHEKFDPLASLIVDHGINSSPQEEFMSLLFGARSSPPLHQFLVSSLSELGLKRVMKAVDGAGKEMNMIIREHLQPAAEIIVFRAGELSGLSRWRSRYHSVGLDEKAINSATEKASLLLVQVERFMRVLTIVTHELQNFFNWLMKCIKLLMSESTEVVSQPNIELVITFLKFHYNRDPVTHFMEACSVLNFVEVDRDTIKRVEELRAFGGFRDAGFLNRTLAKEIVELESSFKEAFAMPFSAISKMICCENFLPLYPISSPSDVISLETPSSVSYCKGATFNAPLLEYICIKTPGGSSDMVNDIVIIKRVPSRSDRIDEGASSQALVLRIPGEYECVDLSLYKDGQIVILVNEKRHVPEIWGHACMMMLRAENLPFTPISRSANQNFWKLHGLTAFGVDLDLKNGRLRSIPHTLSSPLAVSASRGVACVFTRGKRALVYILDEDEDEQGEGSAE